MVISHMKVFLFVLSFYCYYCLSLLQGRRNEGLREIKSKNVEHKLVASCVCACVYFLIR